MSSFHVVAGVGLQLNEQDAKKSVLWEGSVQVIEAPKVQPSAFYSLLCDETEKQSASDEDDPDESAEPGQKAGEKVYWYPWPCVVY